MTDSFRELPRVLPGLVVAAAIALAARLITLIPGWPIAVGDVLVAILLGLLLANLATLPKAAVPGVKFAVGRVLRLGIILLGARLSLGDVWSIGLGALGLVVVCMAVAFGFATFAGRALRLPPRLALLIAVGTAVCGNSAIVATAPVAKAEEREVSFAIATITLFGIAAVFLYPLIGRVLGLSDGAFGLWSGVAVNDTSQVVAASAAFSEPARNVATVVKLVRNTLMAPLILGIAWWANSRWAAGTSDEAAKQGALKAFPLFVLGFLLLALLRTVGVIDRPTAGLLDEVAKGCILVALAGVGLSTRVAQLRSVGAAPFALGLGTAFFLSVLALALIIILHLAPSTGI